MSDKMKELGFEKLSGEQILSMDIKNIQKKESLFGTP